MNRVTHKELEAACAAYNTALKLHYWRGKKPPSIGYLMWADIKGDGSNRRGLYAVTGESGGVSSSYLRKAGDTMRTTKQQIYLAIKCHKSQAFALIIRATSCRGAEQRAALAEMGRRGLWLSDDQKKEAGLV